MMEEIITQLRPRITRSEADPRPIVILMCGMAGSGKSTLSKALISTLPHLTRLSLDNTVAEKHGLYGINYAPGTTLYDTYLDEAWEECKRRLATLLLSQTQQQEQEQEEEKKDIVFDRAFPFKPDRDEIKLLIENLGARWVLIYLRPPDEETLWRRICDRRKEGLNGDCAFEITREMLEGWYQGFEIPVGEGAVVVDTLMGTVGNL
ncbi:ATP/GTP-binding protein [Poronia punctata]|nr:ATP/GTP-binding protein [Poronia punctata]